MTDNLPPLPETKRSMFALDGRPATPVYTAEQMQLYARAAVEASRAAVPAGWVLVPQSLIDTFPEINPSNYNHDDACDLNRWGCEVVTTAFAAPQQVAQPTNEAAFLRSQIALALEEMSCANFNSAAERLRHVTEVAQAKPEQAAQPLTKKQINDLSVWPRMKLEEVVRVIEAAHGIAEPQSKD